jgi:hypothetical protein
MNTTLTSGQLSLQLKLFDEKGMTTDRWNKILSSGIFADLCDSNAHLGDRDAVRTALKLGVTMPEIFELEVDYGETYEQMVSVGTYDCRNNDINAKKFPIKGTGRARFQGKLFHFNRVIESPDAITQIEVADTENPWSAGKIEHLLAFGAKFPEEQRKYPIIGLSSVARVGGHRYVPVLWNYGAGRDLRLGWFDDRWGDYCRFLAVRQISAA